MARRKPPVPASLEDSITPMSVGLEKNASASNYLGWISDLCTPHLGAECLEIGAGHGDLTELFARGRTRYVATDASDWCLDALHTRFPKGAGVEVRALDLATFDPGEERFDSIVMVNVLEHIEDDAESLVRLREALRPGGRLVLYVPAFMLLYSKFDREIGHYRRYRKPGLTALLRESGLRPVDARYVNSIGAPGWFLWVRVLGRASSDDVTVGACDRVVVPAARVFEDRWAPPFGLSVFAVAVRD